MAKTRRSSRDRGLQLPIQWEQDDVIENLTGSQEQELMEAIAELLVGAARTTTAAEGSDE